MPSFRLAQVNIVRMLAPLDDSIMAGFVSRLDEINALADGSPGFVWRFQTKDWFTKFEIAYLALWWVPAGHIPEAEVSRP